MHLQLIEYKDNSVLLRAVYPEGVQVLLVFPDRGNFRDFISDCIDFSESCDNTDNKDIPEIFKKAFE